LTLLDELQSEIERGNLNDSAIRETVTSRCATDLELFARIYFPHYCELAFNEIHYRSFRGFRYSARGIREVLAAPRGYAKSTFSVLIEPIHDLCFRQENFIIILSHTEDQAVAKIKDIRAELLTNNELTSDFDLNFATKKPGASSFIVKSGDYTCKIQAVGQNTELRGIRYLHHRPTKIICDDYEHSEKVFKEELREKERNKFFEVVTKLGSPKTNVKYVGTVLHTDSLLSRLLRNPAYDARKYAAVISWADREDLWQQWREVYTNIDDDDRKAKADAFFEQNQAEMLAGSQVLWPEKEPYYYLMKEMVEAGRRSFFKEKQNEPLGFENKVFEDFQYFREVKDGLLVEKSQTVIPWKELQYSVYLAIDPATGEVKKLESLGDYTAFAIGLQDRKGRLFVYEDWTKRKPPSVWISKIYEFAEKWPEGFNKVAVETNLYRNLLLPNIMEEKKRRERERKKSIKIPFYDVEQVENKVKRITQLEPKVTHGWILFNRTLSVEAIRQFEEFPKGDHDDFPDAVEMLWGLVHNRYKPAAISKSFGDR